jgi:hypothetical protein
MPKTVVAAAGEHYVAYKLFCLGYLAALVRQGSPVIDLLASSMNGGKTVAIQVKTTSWALRTSGRGKNKVPSQLQFPLGHNAVQNASPKLIFCFVDLRVNSTGTLPDVYIVPATVLLQQYQGVNIHQYKLLRYHRSIADMAAFKNNWQPIHNALS